MHSRPDDAPAAPPTSAPPHTADDDAALEQRLVIPVIEETATVSRRRVETGHAVRLRKLVHEEVVTLDGACEVEEVTVERVAVERLLDSPPGVRHEGDVMVVPVVEERLVTLTQLVLVEEIRITRSRRSRPAAMPVTLRREEVVVERFDPDTGEWRTLDVPTTAGSETAAQPDAAALPPLPL